jgi:hypothetical protein
MTLGGEGTSKPETVAWTITAAGRKAVEKAGK